MAAFPEGTRASAPPSTRGVLSTAGTAASFSLCFVLTAKDMAGSVTIRAREREETRLPPPFFFRLSGDGWFPSGKLCAPPELRAPLEFPPVRLPLEEPRPVLAAWPSSVRAHLGRAGRTRRRERTCYARRHGEDLPPSAHHDPMRARP